MNKIKNVLVGVVTMMTPAVMFAADDVGGLLDTFGGLIGKAQVLLVSGVLLMFFYGLFMFVFKGATNADDKEKGKMFMVWAVVAIFLMASVWGIVRVLQGTFVGDTSQMNVPGYKYVD